MRHLKKSNDITQNIHIAKVENKPFYRISIKFHSEEEWMLPIMREALYNMFNPNFANIRIDKWCEHYTQIEAHVASITYLYRNNQTTLEEECETIKKPLVNLAKALLQIKPNKIHYDFPSKKYEKDGLPF